MNQTRQMSEAHFVGLLLAVTGGFLDAYTYICRGHVFANAQTGNIVLLAIQITDQNFKKALYYLMPILAFILGILICEIIHSRYKWSRHIHWRQLVVLIETLCLAAAGFMPLGKADTLVNIMVSFVCALQVEAFRKINGNSYATTMCTGNLRSAAENLYLYIKAKKQQHLNTCFQYYAVILFFIIGASAGGFLTIRFGRQAVWFTCAGLLIVFAAMFRSKQETAI